MPRFLVNMYQLNALPCVFLVVFSDSIVRTVTTLPAKTPARHRVTTICQRLRDMPKSAVANPMPVREKTRTGLRPMRSEARP